MNKLPDLSAERIAELTPQEIAEIRAFLSSASWQKALRIINRKKPSPNCAGAGSTQRDAFSNERANARLGEIRGWEMHEMAIFAAFFEIPKPPPVESADFPDTGNLLGLPPAPKHNPRKRKESTK